MTPLLEPRGCLDHYVAALGAYVDEAEGAEVDDVGLQAEALPGSRS